VALDGRDHILLRDEPAWGHFARELEAFLAPADAAPATEDAGLSEREEQVLALVAQGVRTTRSAPSS